jgi:hypothetical protein
MTGVFQGTEPCGQERMRGTAVRSKRKDCKPSVTRSLYSRVTLFHAVGRGRTPCLGASSYFLNWWMMPTIMAWPSSKTSWMSPLQI